ncbi:MAG: hypothetical protein JJU40_15995 [Rhodobacteraceae bacterium]|nr:hypothetical protein [Paracoccaceae bacterium]MCC6009157.1 hypothetical protein [Paracoccaceae bacterium]
MLSDCYFGDVEAIDEGNNFPEYFHSTFILPTSFSMNSLNNKRKYIIVGRKGSGKTAVQFYLSEKLKEKGYISKFFSFHSDVKPKDYNSAARTQKIDMLGVVNSRNIFLNYDFREIWLRTFLVKIAEELSENSFTSQFTKFVLGKRSRLSSIFEGVLKSASVEISAEMFDISASVGFDFAKYKGGSEVPLSEYISAALELLRRHHQDHLFYLYVDELVLSRLDAADDEVKVRAAMVRDILRSARELNNFFIKHNLDFHIVCALRPEIRNLLNDMDSEIGKLVDGKSVKLEWDMSDGSETLLFRLLIQKVIHSKHLEVINFADFVEPKINFGKKTILLENFIKINTWGRPRDVVQLLNSIADENPDSPRIGEDEIKNALNEYSRRAMNEIKDEISVRHGNAIAKTLRENINKRLYKSFDEFDRSVIAKFGFANTSTLVDDLFHYGVIGNYDDSFNARRYYWFHRGEEFLKPSLGVCIHPGLWNYLNIR